VAQRGISITAIYQGYHLVHMEASEMNWMSAQIEWVRHEEGGRRQPPSGEEPPVYWAVIKLLDAEPQPNSWSMYVRKLSSREEGFLWDAAVQFRVPEAPQHLLTEGMRFELYEGAKCVAHGVVGNAVPETAGQE
jgi:hypothetical protein